MGIQSSRNAQRTVNATAPSKPSGVAAGPLAEGEGPAGVAYTAILNERPNKSLNRNAGPSGTSANTGSLPTPTRTVIKNGRI